MRASSKLVLPVLNSEVLRVANVNQAVIAAPAVTMDDRVNGDATALATDTARAEVRFIHFDFARRERRFQFAILGHALSDFEKDRVDCLARQSG